MNNYRYIISPESLQEQLNNSQIIIVDCRFQLTQPRWGYEQYLLSHIPGAHYLDLDRDLSAAVTKHGGRHPLPQPEVLAEKLAAIGIVQNETLVVVYDDSRFAFAARLWWLLRYLGHDKVALLDGGYSSWQAKAYPVTQDSPSARQGVFVPQIQKNWTVDIETVKQSKELPSTVLIDSREIERFLGKNEPIDPIAGSIPGAINSPWQKVTNENGYFLSETKQKQLWEQLSEEQEIIVYCGSGVTACVNILSLNLAGINNPKLYPGGWSDWCSYLN